MTIGSTIASAEFKIETGATHQVDFWILIDGEICGSMHSAPEQADEMKQRLMLAGFSERAELPVKTERGG